MSQDVVAEADMVEAIIEVGEGIKQKIHHERDKRNTMMNKCKQNIELLHL